MFIQFRRDKALSTAQLVKSPKQLKKGAKLSVRLEDNRAKGVLQAKGINYEAGQGNLWHVHKDHVKYNGDNSSRINFAGRSKTYIKKQMEQYHNTLSHDSNRHHTYLQCRKWINRHL